MISTQHGKEKVDWQRFKPALFGWVQLLFFVSATLYAIVKYSPLLFPGSYPPDFTTYYLAGYGILKGYGTGVYDIQVLHSFEPALGLDAVDNTKVLGFTYPPPFLLIAAPLALLRYDVAKIIWLSLNICCLALSILLLMRYLNIHITWKSGAGYGIGFLFLSYPLLNTIRYGQVNLLILLILTLCYIAVLRNKPLAAGFALGAAIVFKLIPIALLLFFLGRRGWRAIIGCSLSVLLFMVASLPLLGSTSIFDYAQVLAGWGQNYFGYAGNTAPYAILNRIFDIVGDGMIFNITLPVGVIALLNSPLVYLLGFGLIVCSICIWTVYLIGKSCDTTLQFSFACVAMLLVTPLAWFHHLVWLYLPALAMLALYRRKPELFKHYKWWLPVVFIVLNLPPLFLIVPDERISYLLQYLPNLTLLLLFILVARLLYTGRRNVAGEPLRDSAPIASGE